MSAFDLPFDHPFWTHFSIGMGLATGGTILMIRWFWKARSKARLEAERRREAS